jgi:hypothetical protein
MRRRDEEDSLAKIAKIAKIGEIKISSWDLGGLGESYS